MFKKLITYREAMLGPDSEAAKYNNFFPGPDLDDEDGYGPYLLVATRTSNSENKEDSNFETMTARLRALDKFPFDDVWLTKSSHWMVSWIEYLLVNPKNKKLVREATRMANLISVGIILDEKDYNNRQAESAASIDFCISCYEGEHECKRISFNNLPDGDYADDYFKTQCNCVCDKCHPKVMCMGCKHHFFSEGLFIKFRSDMFCDQECLRRYYTEEELSEYSARSDLKLMEQSMVAADQPTLWGNSYD
jgi:hypothetical protein